METEVAFSFKKQPITHEKKLSVISANIPHETSGRTSISTTSAADEASLKSYLTDYDEQIRAPRMNYKLSNAQSSLKSQSSASNPFTLSRNTSHTSNSTLASIDEDSLQDSKPREEKVYLPANFDLNQSTRRYSTPSSYSPQHVLPFTANNPLLNLTASKPTYADIAKKALFNLENNTTSTENTVSNMTSKRERISVTGPLKQVYEPKTPNYIPAVLRPPESPESPYVKSDTYSLNNTATSLETAAGSGSQPSSPISNSTLDLLYPAQLDNEPTHQHWKPDQYRGSCAKCDSKFSLMNRRHHCRHCGDIYCKTCCSVQARLSKDAKFIYLSNFDPFNGSIGKLVKVCVDCGTRYGNFVSENNEKFNEMNGNGKDHRNDSISEERARQVSEVGVPADWTWSSF